MYDPDHDWVYPELAAVRQAPEGVVERAYGIVPSGGDKETVERLFQLYAKAVNRLIG